MGGQRLNPGERYLSLFERWGMLALQQLITGCHVHVAVDDPELTIAVLDRVRPWLPVLVAFDALVADLVRAGAIDDATHLYWDARPSVRYPTLEFRVGDVCPSVDVAVLYAALARSLTRTFVAAAQREEDAAPDVLPEVLRIARWRAARHGLTEQLVHPVRWDLRPATEVVEALLDLVRDDLQDAGEWDEVRDGVGRLLTDGTASARYRQLMERTGDLRKVTEAAVEETAGGSG